MNSSLYILIFVSVLYKRLQAQTDNSLTKGPFVIQPNVQNDCENGNNKCKTVHYTNLVSAVLNGLRSKKRQRHINSSLIRKFSPALQRRSTALTKMLRNRAIKTFISSRRSSPIQIKKNSENQRDKPEFLTTKSMFIINQTQATDVINSDSQNVSTKPLHSYPIHRNNKRNRDDPMTESKNATQYLLFENVEANEINKTLYSYHPNNKIYPTFLQNLDQMEREYYQVSFKKLLANAPPGREENGISFAQSGVLLYLTLMAMSTEVEADIKSEINRCLGAEYTDDDKNMIIEKTLSSFPSSKEGLKIRFAFRLLLSPNISVTDKFKKTSESMNFHVDQLNGTETPEMLTRILNQKVAIDSGGAMQNTFDEDELSSGVSAVLTSILYVRGRWRAAPTLLNGTTVFRDITNNPPRTFCSIRINDVMRYAEFQEWDAEGLEVSYATPGLTLLLLVPRGNSLRRLAGIVATTSILNISRRLQTLRAAVTLPLYTLRMTLLLPNKLEAMGMPRLVDRNTTTSTLRLSHAVQRLMFWSEPGRNAFKDDGIEWDAPPEIEILIDRPYIYFVRWNNMTLLNGNFVL